MKSTKNDTIKVSGLVSIRGTTKDGEQVESTAVYSEFTSTNTVKADFRASHPNLKFSRITIEVESDDNELNPYQVARN